MPFPTSPKLLAVLLGFLALALLSAPLRAQESWKWPEQMKNPKAFPKDFPAEKLQAVMKGFTRALGVRCSYCHVGQEGRPLQTYDFASDQNPNKERAREMYRMLGDINGHLKKITPSGDRRVNMWCNTCHRGRPKPMTLGEELGEAYRKGGVTGAIDRYRELREKFELAGAYDFREHSLDAFASELQDQKDNVGALAVLRLNVSEFPKSSDAWESLADGYRAAGNADLAVIYYRKALEIDPQNDTALASLRGLEKH
jgi:tetratricopeptide (TPR) repeat protein